MLTSFLFSVGLMVSTEVSMLEDQRPQFLLIYHVISLENRDCFVTRSGHDGLFSSYWYRCVQSRGRQTSICLLLTSCFVSNPDVVRGDLFPITIKHKSFCFLSCSGLLSYNLEPSVVFHISSTWFLSFFSSMLYTFWDVFLALLSFLCVDFPHTPLRGDFHRARQAIWLQREELAAKYKTETQRALDRELKKLMSRYICVLPDFRSAEGSDRELGMFLPVGDWGLSFHMVPGSPWKRVTDGRLWGYNGLSISRWSSWSGSNRHFQEVQTRFLPEGFCRLFQLLGRYTLRPLCSPMPSETSTGWTGTDLWCKPHTTVRFDRSCLMFTPSHITEVVWWGNVEQKCRSRSKNCESRMRAWLRRNSMVNLRK